jgi:peroxiredoxin
LRDIAETLTDLGATLVAITPQIPEHSRGLIEKHRLTFDLLSDPGNVYAAELGLRFALPADLRAIYGEFGIDLPAFNGDDSWTLPLPARLVVDRAGIVGAADIDPNHTQRPEPAKTVDDVRALG